MSKGVDEEWVEDIWGDRNFGYVQRETSGSSGDLLVVWDKKVFSCAQTMTEERFIVVKGK